MSTWKNRIGRREFLDRVISTTGAASLLRPGQAARPGPRRVVVFVEVGSLLTRNPFHGNGTSIGLVVRKGTSISSRVLEVMDDDSRGFTRPRDRPNLDTSSQVFDEDSGQFFIGWKVLNRDENLPRLLRATFVIREEPGPTVVQAGISNCFSSKTYGATSFVQELMCATLVMGVAVPETLSGGLKITGVRFRASPQNSPWYSSIDKISHEIVSDGTASDPTTARHRQFSIRVDNSSDEAARWCRLTVGPK